jgi:hypothetical protein
MFRFSAPGFARGAVASSLGVAPRHATPRRSRGLEYGGQLKVQPRRSLGGRPVAGKNSPEVEAAAKRRPGLNEVILGLS